MSTFTKQQIAALTSIIAQSIAAVMSEAQEGAAVTPTLKVENGGKARTKARAEAALASFAASAVIGQVTLTKLGKGGARTPISGGTLALGTSRTTQPLDGEGQLVYTTPFGFEISERAVARLKEGKQAKVFSATHKGWVELARV